jgi:hypothetical protein
MFAKNVDELWVVLVPVPDVCQYQVTPAAGEPLNDKVFGPHVFVDATGAGGLKIGLMVTA